MGQNTTQARGMLRKLLGGSKIEMEGFREGRERGYKFRGELSVGKLISGPPSRMNRTLKKKAADPRSAAFPRGRSCVSTASPARWSR
jgi:hypothetical protein